MLRAKAKVGLPRASLFKRKPGFSAAAVRPLLTWAIIGSVPLFACDDNGADDSDAPANTPTDSDRDSASAYVRTTTLTLGANELSPGEVTNLDVQVNPPGSHDVQLAITEGAALAFLNDSVLITDGSGHARTTLTATRSGVGSVRLQALVNGAAPEYLDAQIVPPSEATLNVVPRYAGDRPFTEWHVAILDEPNCPLDHTAYVDQEAKTFTRTDEGEPLFLSDVPAGHPLSILVRAEEYAFGCAPGVVVTNEKSQVVEVNVTDLPLVVDDLAFTMRFGVYVHSDPFWLDLGSYLSGIGDAFRGEFAADSVALLSKMETLASSPQAFRSNRESKSWDALLELRLSAEGASQGLTSRIQRWLLDGAQLLQSDAALRAHVEAATPKEGTTSPNASVNLLEVASLSPSDVGITTSLVPGTLNTSGTDDVLRLAFTVEFEPSRLFGALAAKVVTSPMPITRCEASSDGPPQASDGGLADAGSVDAGSVDTGSVDAAITESDRSDASLADAFASDFGSNSDARVADAGVADPPAALADIVGCSSVGLWLSEGTGYAYEECDASCASRLCEDAIAALWQQVLDADTTKKTLQLSAAGRAALDERAHVIGLTQGEWIGTTDLFRAEPKGTLQGCTTSLSR